MRPFQQRALLLCLALGAFAVAVFFVLSALRENIVYYKTPATIMEKPPTLGERIRIGGYVRPQSLKRGSTIAFMITDFTHDIKVRFQGLPPALFREGQGVIAEGHFSEDGVFDADMLLAKHDENYRPPQTPPPQD